MQVLGTRSGTVMTVDFNGNAVREFKAAHNGRVHSVVADATGTTIASCGSDGTVVLQPHALPAPAAGGAAVTGAGPPGAGVQAAGVGDGGSLLSGATAPAVPGERTVFNYHRPVLAVALHPQFATHKERPFVSGACVCVCVCSVCSGVRCCGVLSHDTHTRCSRTRHRRHGGEAGDESQDLVQ